MAMLDELPGWVTVEHVKACAAVMQAFGVIVAAFLAYLLSRRLERHKYEIRVEEIMFSKFHEKRLHTLESISAIPGKILYETSELLFFGGVKETASKKECESREEYLERSFEPRHKDITAALMELHNAQESGIVYLPEPIYSRLTDFRVAIAKLVRGFTSEMLIQRADPEHYGQLHDKAIARFKELRAERDQIVKAVRSYIEVTKVR